jgi:protein TonB
MFKHLVESGSHRGEFARKSRFMLGTLGLYAALLAASGVAGVFAYDARLERQSLEITWMLAPVPVEAAPRPDNEPPRPRGDAGARSDAVPERVDAIARLNDSTKPPETISTRPNALKELPDTSKFIKSGRDFDPGGAGLPVGPRDGDGAGFFSRERAAPPVRVNAADDPLPPPTPAPAPTQKPPSVVRASSSVISGKVLSTPAPPYPAIAKAMHTSGTVNVEILIDEGGGVISARAINGPAVLRIAAVQAARQARFTPTILGGQPVKVSGVITYNFVLN